MAGPDVQLWLVNERLAEWRRGAQRRRLAVAVSAGTRFTAHAALGRLLNRLGERLASDSSALARFPAVQR
jgi:hypothetical protein